MNHFPTQRLSYDDKIKNNYEWAKKCILHFTHNQTDSDISSHMRGTSEYERKLSNYQLYNNILNQQDFERVCNPLGINVGQFKDEVQPYNKIYNKVQILLGEELQRPFRFRAFLINEEGVKSKLMYRDELLKQYIMSQLSEYIKPDNSEQQVLDPNQIKKYLATTYQEVREITANKVLKALKHKLDLKTLKADAFKHALISGEEHVWIGEEGGQPIVRVMNPLSMFYHKSPDTKYVQDALYAGSKQYLTHAEVLDRFGRYLSEEDRDKLENNQYYNWHTHLAPLIENVAPGQHSQNNAAHILVIHVEWKSYRKVGFLTTTQDGESVETLVDEYYKVPSHATKEIVEERYNSKITYYK